MHDRPAPFLLALVLTAFGVSLFLPEQNAGRTLLALPGAFLLPGFLVAGLLGADPGRTRYGLLAPLLSPLILGAVTAGVGLAGLSPTLWVRGVIVVSGLLAIVLERRDGEGSRWDTPPALAWWVGAGFALVVASLVVPFEGIRLNSDAWFHSAVIANIERGGFPPRDPYFSGMPLQYFWYYHAVVLGLMESTGLSPLASMSALNLSWVLISVPAASRIAIHLGASPRGSVWAGVVFLGGLGGLFWLFFPVKLISALIGDVRGMEAVRQLVDLDPFDIPSTTRVTQIVFSSNFVLKKFIVSNAASGAMVLGLVAAHAAIRFVTDGKRRGMALFFVLALAAFYLHVIMGGTTLAALAGGVLLGTVLRRITRARAFAVSGTVLLALVLGLPYLRLTAGSKEAENLFPIGVSLLAWVSLVFTLAAVVALAWPTLRRLAGRPGHPGSALFLGWTLFAFLYAVFGRLPGPNQYDKPPLVVFMPLAIAAGVTLPALWSRLAGRSGLRFVLGVFLFLYLVPENAFRYAGFFADRHGASIAPDEASAYRWIGENTPRDAIFIDSEDRVEVLVRGPRRQYWGRQTYAEQWGYPVDEMTVRRGVRDALYAPHAPTSSELKPLFDLSDAVYVMAREEDSPGAARRLAASPLFEPVFSEGGITILRLVAPPPAS